ncbi:MAG: caspase family protein [Pseudomonadota bacterium]|nr:caspase family protein [Pseudomonadota bacterium]
MWRAILCAVVVLTMVNGVGWGRAAEPPREPILKIETGMHTEKIGRIGVDDANRYLVTASSDKSVRVWELATGRLLSVLRPPMGEGDEGKIYAVAISPDGQTVACGGWTGKWEENDTIYLFHRPTGELTRRITGLPNCILHLSFSPDGRYLAAALGGDNGIRVFRTADGKLAGEDRDYGSNSYSVAFDRRGRLAAASLDGYIRLYNRPGAAGLKLLARQKAPGGKEPFSLSFSPDGEKLAVGFADSTRVDVLSAADLSHLYSPDTSGVDKGNLGLVSFSPDGRLYAGGIYYKGGQCPILSWDNDGRGVRRELPGSPMTIMHILPLAAGGVVYGAYDPAFGVLDRNGRRILYQSAQIADYRGNWEGFRLSADGKKVSFGYEVLGKSPATFDLSTRTLSPGGETSGLYPPDTKSLSVTDWKYTTSPKLNGRALALAQYERSRSLAISPSRDAFLLGADWSLRYFDRSGNEKWRTSVPGAAWAVNISRDGRLAVAAFSDGTIRWYRLSDGRELLAFFPHKDRRRWVVWTPEGFFDASEGGTELIGYHLNRGKDRAAEFIGVDKLYDQFYRPDLVLAKFEGKDISEYAQKVNIGRLLSANTLPPAARLFTSSATAKKRDIDVQGEICDQGGGIGDVTLFLNGMPVIVDPDGRTLKLVSQGTGGGKKPACKSFRHTVTLTEGENIIGLMARNKDNSIESNRAEARLTFHSGYKEKPDLYILAVAVNKYRDGDLRLKYPRADADELVKSIQKGAKRIFGKIAVKTVYDEAATRAGLALAFEELGRQTRREDVFILFLAGHGITYEKDGNYYFLPVDFRFTGEEAIAKQGVSKEDLMKNLTHIQALKSLLLLDTCNSGSFAEAVASRNIVEKTAVARLGKATGRSTLVASSKDQAALEGYEGHGVFTYTLLQAINGAARDREGKVTVNGLATYVEETMPALTYKKWGYEQIPQKNLQGMDFPLVLP